MCINFSYGPSTWESILLVILLKRKGELHNTLSQKQCIRVSAKVGSKNEPYFNLDNLEKVSMMPNEIIFKFHQRGVTVTKPKHLSTAVEFSHTSCLVKHHCPTPPPPPTPRAETQTTRVSGSTEKIRAVGWATGVKRIRGEKKTKNIKKK